MDPKTINKMFLLRSIKPSNKCLNYSTYETSHTNNMYGSKYIMKTNLKYISKYTSFSYYDFQGFPFVVDGSILVALETWHLY